MILSFKLWTVLRKEKLLLFCKVLEGYQLSVQCWKQKTPAKVEGYQLPGQFWKENFFSKVIVGYQVSGQFWKQKFFAKVLEGYQVSGQFWKQKFFVHSGHTSWKSWKSWKLAICPGMSLNVLENGFDLAFVLEMSWNSSLSGVTKISFDEGF